MALKRVSYWKHISPRGAVSDIVHEWKKPNPYRWQILAVSVAATFTMMTVLIPKSEHVEPRPPKITYITTFAPGRSEAEILASNKANQIVQDKRRAEEAAKIERRKEFFRALGRATFIDVDQLEKEYADAPKPAVTVAPAASGR